MIIKYKSIKPQQKHRTWHSLHPPLAGNCRSLVTDEFYIEENELFFFLCEHVHEIIARGSIKKNFQKEYSGLFSLIRFWEIDRTEKFSPPPSNIHCIYLYSISEENVLYVIFDYCASIFNAFFYYFYSFNVLVFQSLESFDVYIFLYVSIFISSFQYNH